MRQIVEPTDGFEPSTCGLRIGDPCVVYAFRYEIRTARQVGGLGVVPEMHGLGLLRVAILQEIGYSLAYSPRPRMGVSATRITLLPAPSRTRHRERR